MKSQRVRHNWATRHNTHTHKQFRSSKLYQKIFDSLLHWSNMSILSATKRHSRFRYSANSKKHAFWGPSNSDSWMIICARICVWIHRPISLLSLSSWTVSFTKLLFYHLKSACFRKMRNSTKQFYCFSLAFINMLQSHILKDKFFSGEAQKQLLRNTVYGQMATYNWERTRYTPLVSKHKTHKDPCLLWFKISRQWTYKFKMKPKSFSLYPWLTNFRVYQDFLWVGTVQILGSSSHIFGS